MPCFVVGNAAFFVFAHDPLFLFQTSRDAFDAIVELFLADIGLAFTGCEQSGFVDEIREVRTDKAGCNGGDLLEFDIRPQASRL